jgi:hypothetical protein
VIRAPWHISKKQILQDLEVLYFADHISPLTESVEPALPDAGNPVVRNWALSVEVT